jgi:hypothetical protein
MGVVAMLGFVHRMALDVRGLLSITFSPNSEWGTMFPERALPF